MSDYLTDEEKAEYSRWSEPAKVGIKADVRKLLKELADLSTDFAQYRQLHEAMVVEMERQTRIITFVKDALKKMTFKGVVARRIELAADTLKHIKEIEDG